MYLLLSKHFPAAWSLHKTQLSFRISRIYLATQIIFRGSLSPFYILPSCNACFYHFPDKNTQKNSHAGACDVNYF